MAIKGSLKEASLADVCQLLALGQKTGCLSVTDRSRFGQIFFDRGRITYSRIVNRRDRLGDLMVRDGALSQEQLQQVLALQTREPDKRFGEILLECGFLDSEALTQFIRMQIEEAIYHLFTWTRGNFFFEADERPEAADVLVSINPDSLLLEAARRVDEWSLIEKKIPSLDLVFEVDRVRVMETFSDLTPEQQRIIALLDGTHNVQEIADETGLSEFDAGKALYGLIQAGLANRVGRKSEPEGARSKEAEIKERRNLGVAFYRTAMLDDAAREFQRLLELSPGDLQASYHLALIALRSSRSRDAVRQFKAILETTGPHFGAFVNLAVALRALRRPEDAILVLGEADQLRPGTPIVALSRGVALIEAGRYGEATAAFEEYRKRVPAGEKPAAMYYYYGALAFALNKQLNQAETLIREGDEQHPDNAPISLMRGLVAERRGDYDHAERFFRDVVEEDPTLVFAHKNLGDVVYRRGEHEAALEHYQRAMQINPNIGDDTCAKVGNIHYKLRERDEALRYWARALELNPNNQVVRNNIEIVQNAG